MHMGELKGVEAVEAFALWIAMKAPLDLSFRHFQR
jgi:hypothetical protein